MTSRRRPGLVASGRRRGCGRRRGGGSCRTTWCCRVGGSWIPRPGSTVCVTWGSTATRSRRSATVSTARRPSMSAGSSSLRASSTSTATRRRCRDGGSRRATASPPRSTSKPAVRRWRWRMREKRSEVPRSTTGSRRRGRPRACTWSRTGRSTVVRRRSSAGWSAPIGNRRRPRRSWRGSSTRSRPTSPPAPSVSACSSATRPGSNRPSTSPSRNWRPPPASRRSPTRVTSSSWLRRR